MKTGFQVHVDARGDLWMADGMVIDKSTGDFFHVGDGDADGGGLTGEPATNYSETVEAPSVTDLVLLGGSGRNVIVTGIAPFAGVWRPQRPGIWSKGDFLLTVTGSSAATISDAADVVAELTTGGDAPGGDYVATTYGETTYNSSSAFTLTGAKEIGWPGGYSSLVVTISEGTAQSGVYTTTDGVLFVSEEDADWTITLNTDGSADFAYDGTVIATRAVGPLDDPCGAYVATTAGKLLNPEFPEVDESAPADENPFGTLTLVFDWSTFDDLDIGVTFAGETVGYGYASSGTYMTWTGDDTGTGSETVVIDLAQAWEDGAILTYADVLALADWFPDAGGSGPASLTVTYDLPGAPGTPVTHILHPGSNTPAITSALALRVTAAGASAPVGSDWTATVRAVRRPTVAGVVHIGIEEDTDHIAAVTGPFFAATLPDPSGATIFFPVAVSDGTGKVKQIQTGPLLWEVTP